MYHKSRRTHRRFYPEFYDDEETEVKEVKEDIELKLEPEPEENIQEAAAEQEMPANYNDLLYPSRIRPESVFKQLENMQKDYIQKKLAVSRTNNSSINPEITGSDKIINRNEAEAINDNQNNNTNNNELRLEIPDSMYTGEIKDLHNNITDKNINNNENINENKFEERMEYETEILYKMTNAVTEDVLSTSAEASEYSAEPEYNKHNEHNENNEEYNEDSANPGNAIQTFESVDTLEPFEPFESFEPLEPLEARIEKSFTDEITEDDIDIADISNISNIADDAKDVVERDYSSRRSEVAELYEYNPKFIPFDKIKAIEYAQRWALDRNPNFLDFDELGGDCTNYISQILLAGGCKMDHTPVYGWYYSSGSEKSPSWTGVEQIYNYLVKEKKYGIIAKEINAEEARAGDIVQLSFNGRNFQHTPFIVEVSQSSDVPFHFDSIKICAHSFDSQNRALDTYQWRKIRFIRILGYLDK